MPTQAVYFDDIQQEAKKYAARLSRGDLAVKGLPPPIDLNLENALTIKPDLFLVDYELTRVNRTTKERANYNGGTLALHLREKQHDCPVVLLTRENLSVWIANRPVLDTLGVFDDVIFKSQVESEPHVVAERLRRLAQNFNALREAARTWQSLLGLLGSRDDDEERILNEAGPPLRSNYWEVTEAARWIQDVIVEHPGILYDELHCSALLGISRSAFLRPEVQKLFEAAKYDGCFAPSQGRWWKNRVVSIATEFLMTLGKEGSVNRHFRETFERKSGIKLDPAICNSSDEVPADWVCHVLNEPVKVRYSLTYFPDQRPVIMDEARVSFKAIRESNEVNDDLFGPDAQSIIKEIRKVAR
jgi:hypothetical protein